MAKTNITYRCGHSDTIQIYGPYAGRDRAAEREAEKLCPGCYRAELAQKRAAESAAAAEDAKAIGLPALTGSAKQSAWAESIRATQADILRNLDNGLANAPDTANAEAVRIGREIIAATLARTSAHDWIEGRDTTLDRHWLLREVRARMGQ